MSDPLNDPAAEKAALRKDAGKTRAELAADDVGAAGRLAAQAGIVIEMEPLTGPNTTFWPITAGGERVGEVTSAVWSPRLAQHIALAMVRVDAADVGTALTVETNLGPKAATVVEKPFYDPKKSLATG